MTTVEKSEKAASIDFDHRFLSERMHQKVTALS